VAAPRIATPSDAQRAAAAAAESAAAYQKYVAAPRAATPSDAQRAAAAAAEAAAAYQKNVAGPAIAQAPAPSPAPGVTPQVGAAMYHTFETGSPAEGWAGPSVVGSADIGQSAAPEGSGVRRSSSAESSDRSSSEGMFSILVGLFGGILTCLLDEL